MMIKMLRGRRFSILAALMLVVTLLVGCGDATTAPTAASTTAVAVATTATPTVVAATTAASAATTSAATTTAAQTTAATTTSAASTTVVAATTAPATTTGPASTTAAPTTGVASTNVAGTIAATTSGVATTPVAARPTTYQNPVLTNDFADPSVFQFNGTFYAYATNANGKNIQVATSPDMINWTLGTDAMPGLPKWARFGGSLVWAPDVRQIGSKFVMYYTARDKASNKQCVGVATSDKPEGKYQDTSDKALVCQVEDGGTIDPQAFQDNNKLYLYFKNDGNCCNILTSLYVQELAADGLSLTGQPTKLLSNDFPWEGRVVEAPQMFKHDNKFYLFFSANDYSGAEYSVGYAACNSPVGPCQQADENPILKSALRNPPVIGPGGQSVLQVGDQTWIFYHAWEVTASGTKTDRRLMWLDKIDWVNSEPVVRGPSSDPQPTPKVKS